MVLNFVLKGDDAVAHSLILFAFSTLRENHLQQAFLVKAAIIVYSDKFLPLIILNSYYDILCLLINWFLYIK